MPYQTGMSPCYSCKIPVCRICRNSIYEHPHYLDGTFAPTLQDKFIERLWRECEDIAWVENEDGELVLDQPWRGFEAGEFTQDDWFHFVDDHHSKGVGWVYENISSYDFEIGGKINAD